MPQRHRRSTHAHDLSAIFSCRSRHVEPPPAASRVARRRRRRRAARPVAARARSAVLELDVTQGNVQPMPIAMPDFVAGSAGGCRSGAQCHPDHHRQSPALRPVRADRSGGLSRRSSTSTPCRGLPTGARSTPRRWSPAASRGRATAGSRPSSGCGTCSPAASSPASNISPRPTTGGASPTSSPMRSMSG